MIGKANPRNLAFCALRPRHKCVQKNFDTSVPADLVENQLDGFGIEDQENTAMPLRRRASACGSGRVSGPDYTCCEADAALGRLVDHSGFGAAASMAR